MRENIMSVDYYHRIVNGLDKEIADLEKKKASADKRAADEQKKAARVTISKNASASIIKSRMNQITRYKEASVKAANESASLSKKIADKRKRRNDAYLKLQKEQQNEQRKQEKQIKNMQKTYESKIKNLSDQMIGAIIENAAIETTPIVNSPNIEGEQEYDVFVSHAWEDKEDFVEEFVEELRNLGIKVWYDKNRIKWGDSMRAKIDEGLKKSKFGVAVLSPNYIAEGKYWTKAELDGLFQLESVNGKTLLPIWHKLTKKEVMEYSPVIASKLAMNTASMTAKEIAENLLELIKETVPEE